MNSLHKWLTAWALAGVLAGCDPGEKYDGPSPREVNALYSNQQSASDERVLQLTYNGREVTGREVYFEMTGSDRAALTLLDILPGERKTSVTDVKLVAGEGGYTFSGAAAGSTGVRFGYRGTVRPDRLVLELSGIKIPENPFTRNPGGKWYPVKSRLQEEGEDPETGKYVLYHTAFRMEASDEKLNQYSSLINRVAGNLLTSVLKEVAFHEDGLITAMYAPLPEEFSIAALIFSPLQRPDSVWLVSPSDLVLYRVSGNRLYVLPNVDMIVGQLLTRKSSLRSAGSGFAEPDDLRALYVLLNRWATTGISFHIETPFAYREITGEAGVRYEGDLYLYLDKAEIEALIPLFPLIKTLLPDEVTGGASGSLIGTMLDALAEGLDRTASLKIGVMLNEKDTAN